MKLVSSESQYHGISLSCNYNTFLPCNVTKTPTKMRYCKGCKSTP